MHPHIPTLFLRLVRQGFVHLFLFLYQIAEGTSQLFGNLELPCSAERRALSAHEQIQRTILNKLLHHDIYRQREGRERRMVFYANEYRYQILFLSDTQTRFLFAYANSSLQTQPSRAHRQLSSEYLGLLLNGPGSVVCN